MSERGETSIVVFGKRAVLEALSAERVVVERIVVDRATPASFRKDLRAACRAAVPDPVELVEADRREVSNMSQSPRNDQGVAAAIRLGGVMEAEDFGESLKGARAKAPARVIALDNVTNPQNVGMIVRSALAAGMSAILWPTVGAPWVSGLVIKSSAGTVYALPIVRCGKLEEGLWTLKKYGFSLVGLTAGAPTLLRDHEPSHRACYVVGSETTGISDEVEELLDERVSIPMRNNVESLNAAVAASLVCFHVAAEPS